MDGLWQALHHSVRLPFFSVSFWVNTIDLSETASTWRVFPHPSRKRDRVTWFSAKLAFDSLSKLFHCCRIHEHPWTLSTILFFFCFIPSKSISLCRLNAYDASRGRDWTGVESGMTEVEGIFRKLRDVKLLWGSSSLPVGNVETSLLTDPAPNSPLCTPV